MAALRQFFHAAAALLVLSLSAPAPASAQSNLRLVEQDIKAGLLYNFLRYTDWGPSLNRSNRMVVCTFGPDAFDGRLARMAGRTVNQRMIEVRAARTYADLSTCALVFVSADVRAEWPALRTQLAGRSILTVSDFDGFTRSGGMIEFTRINSRVGVRVNVDAVEAADLSVQDRLLRLATVVEARAP
jgi:hypothetical protein